MGASPRWKVYDSNGIYQAACKEPEAAGALVAMYGNGSTIRDDHKTIVWIEGAEEQQADASWDFVALTIYERLERREVGR